MKGVGEGKGDGQGKGLPVPLSLSSCVCPGHVVIGLCCLVVVACGVVVSSLCVGIVSLLGRVASLSSSRVRSCRRCGWSSSLASLSHCCAVSSSLPSHVSSCV